MRSFLGDTLIRQHNDPLCIAHCRQPVGDDQRGAVAAEHFHRLAYRSFAFVVERAGCFIKDEDRWVFQKDAGNAQPLLLSAGKFDASLTNIRVVAMR